MDQTTINYTPNISHSGISKPSYPVDPPPNKALVYHLLHTHKTPVNTSPISFIPNFGARSYISTSFFHCLSVLQRDASPTKLV
jgi:hypothetical protein